MKSTIFFVLAGLALTIPCAAQADETQPTPSPEMQKLLRNLHTYSGPRPLSPKEREEVRAGLAQNNEIEHAGQTALDAGDFRAAEYNFRQIAEQGGSSDAYYHLAEALAGQGRIAEAIQQYRKGISCHQESTMLYAAPTVDGVVQPVQWVSGDCPCFGMEEVRAWMQYALLLSQTGQKAEAVMIYTKALPMMPDEDRNLRRLPDPASLSPAAFQSSIHIVLGLFAGLAAYGGYAPAGYGDALGEFGQALRLAPDSPLANYYFAYGWSRFSSGGREKALSAGRARAALLKAAATGEPDVKASAARLLADMDKPW